jgi:hypothetical protein
MKLRRGGGGATRFACGRGRHRTVVKDNSKAQRNKGKIVWRRTVGSACHRQEDGVVNGSSIAKETMNEPMGKITRGDKVEVTSFPLATYCTGAGTRGPAREKRSKRTRGMILQLIINIVLHILSVLK